MMTKQILVTFVFAAVLGCASKKSSPAASTPSSSTDATAATSGTPTDTPSPTPTVSPTATPTPSTTPPTILGLATAALNQNTVACGAFTIQTETATATAAVTAAAVTINLTTTATTSGAFYSDAACTAAITSTSIAAAASAVTVYYHDTAAGTPTLTAADAATTAPLTAAAQTATIFVSVPVKIGITTAALSQGDSICGLVTVAVEDSANNPTAASQLTYVELSTSSANGEFFADAACTEGVNYVQIAAGTATASVYYKDTKIGAPTIIASPTTSGLSATTQAETISGGTVTKLSFYNHYSSGTANTCMLFGVNLVDAAGVTTSTTADTPVALTTSATTGTFYSDLGCQNQITTLNLGANDTSFTMYYRQTGTGTAVLGVTGGSGSTLTGETQTITFH